MLVMVARLLAGREEDAALIFNGDLLLLTRLDGRLVKHRRPPFWDWYHFADEIIP